MNKFKRLKYYGMAYFLLDIIVQFLMLCGIDHYVRIIPVSFYNFLVMYCFLWAIFSETKIELWLALIGILIIFILVILFWVKFFRNKKCFLIPLCITAGNALIHIVLLWDQVPGYSGFVFKIIGCILYSVLVYEEYGKRRKVESDKA